MQKKVLHFSGLNGLRAIAALSVLFSHTTHALSSFGLNSFIFGSYPDGNPKTTLLAGFGVSIFFALSGFLITYLLLEEKRTKEINIRNFYIRRVLRIWPLYYLYFLLSMVTLFIFDIPFETTSVLFYIFLAANIPYIFGGAIGFLSHYWSLGVEEQFYSFWPWVIKKSKFILRTTSIICISLIVLKGILRYIDISANQGEMNWPYEVLHTTRFQCMLIGAIGAILYFQKNSLFLRITNNLIAQAISWFVILLVALNKFHIISFLDNEIISVVTVFLIIGQIQKTRRIVNLDTSFFDFVGKISYGIYVIFPLVIFYLSKAISFSDNTNVFSYLAVYFSVFLTTIILAYLSYEFFEKRFLSLKEKYSTIRTSDTTDHEPKLSTS
jgi:peptidoglycan/LPS O-acetylase OafA/YrhL